MTTMIERVARAIFDDEQGERTMWECTALARAAIAAMREPTVNMLRVEAGVADKWSADCYGAPLPAEDVWTTMIDAALEEGE